MLLTGQTNLKPESRRAWEIVQGITFQGTEQGQGEWRVDLGLQGARTYS